MASSRAMQTASGAAGTATLPLLLLPLPALPTCCCCCCCCGGGAACSLTVVAYEPLVHRIQLGPGLGHELEVLVRPSQHVGDKEQELAAMLVHLHALEEGGQLWVFKHKLVKQVHQRLQGQQRMSRGELEAGTWQSRGGRSKTRGSGGGRRDGGGSVKQCCGMLMAWAAQHRSGGMPDTARDAPQRTHV